MPSRHLFNRRALGALGLACIAALSAPGQARAQDPAGDARTFDAADRQFVEQAAQGGLAEVAMGQMAQQRGSHAQVKAFGQRMVQDHTKANDELKRVASTKGVQLPATMGSAHRHHAEALGKLSGASFDRAYMKHMLDDHKKDISDFEKAARAAKDPALKDFAARTLPTLQMHLRLAQTTHDAVK